MNALGHDLKDVAEKPATCYENGHSAYKDCSRCDHIEGKVIYFAGHTGEWIADGNYEYIICSDCGRKQIREKYTVIDFNNEAIIDPNSKFSVTVGALTGTAAEGAAPTVDITTGVTSGGNGRLQISVENAVLKLVADATQQANYNVSSLTIKHTDADHSKETGGRYLVFEFDLKLGKGSNSTLPAFQINLYDAVSGGNNIVSINVATYNNTVNLNNTKLDSSYVADDANGTWMTIRLVSQLATELEDGKYASYHTLYYKHKGSDEVMKQAGSTLKTHKNNYTGNVGRTADYTIRLVQFESINKTDPTKSQWHPSQQYWMDNISFIRTADTNYLYSACDHEIKETITHAICTEDAIVTRECTVDGCEYVETETVCGTATSSHNFSAWTDIAGNKQQRSCGNEGCTYTVTRDKLLGNAIYFDNGTIMDGGKLIFPTGNVTVAEDGKTATDKWGYANWSISSDLPGRPGETALRVQTVKENWASGRSQEVTIPATSSTAEGNTYILDFDIYVEPGVGSTDTSSRPLAEIKFGRHTYTMGTNATRVTRYAQSFSFGTTNTWISFRFVYTVTADKTASLVVSVKQADGKYKSIDEIESITGSEINLSGVNEIVFTSYASNYNFVYYLDNISFTRTSSAECNHVVNEWTTTVQPSCTVRGEMEGACANCSTALTTYIPALGHTLGDTVAAKSATCTDAGHTEYQVCSTCQEKFGYTEIPALGHNLSDWTNVEDGTKQKKTCVNGCGYYELRTVLADAPVTFDDGTVHDGEKLSFSRDDLTFGEGDVSAVDQWGFANWSISTTVPGREGQTALRIQTTKANWANGRTTNLIVAPTDGGTEGNVYVLDFDFYSENSYYNGTRQILQIYFGGSVTNFDQYKNDLKIGSAVLGTWEQWISLRIVYTVNVNGEATREVFKKDAEGNYVSMGVGTVKNSGIKLDTNIAIGFCSYASEVNRDYYLDNISFTRHTAGYEVTE